MIRAAARLTARTFDLLVVGGGIYGLAIAYDAADRGLAVALIEKDDFGSGSSFNHLRTIHGGLRYLQTLDLVRARESVNERRTIARIAPHTVAPLPFVLPLYPSPMKGKMAMRAGFLLDRIVAARRNSGVPPSHRLPAGRVVSRHEAIDRFPALPRQRLTGAAVWYDYIATESDRLVFSFALAADARGAVLANHVEAVAPLVEGRRVVGVRATDHEAGREVEIGARLVVNATGGAVDRLLGPLGLASGVPMLKAMNLVTRRDAGQEAIGARTASGRNLFMVPWRGRALFGTWESGRAIARGEAGITEADVALFVADLNESYPPLDLSLDEVTLVHRGIVPAAMGRDGRVALEGHEQIRDHARDGVQGLLTVAGTKFTTGRAVAERVTDQIQTKLGVDVTPSRTADKPLPGGDVDDVAATIRRARQTYDAQLPPDTLPHLVGAYGTRWREPLEPGSGKPEWLARVADDSPVVGAELAWAARHEMAVTLIDAVVRRTPLGALGHPGGAAAARAAEILAGELDWAPERVRTELEALERFYLPVRVR